MLAPRLVDAVSSTLAVHVCSVDDALVAVDVSHLILHLLHDAIVVGVGVVEEVKDDDEIDAWMQVNGTTDPTCIISYMIYIDSDSGTYRFETVQYFTISLFGCCTFLWLS